MKCRSLILFLICIVLCACTQNMIPPAGDEPIDTPSVDDTPDTPSQDLSSSDQAVSAPAKILTMELVVEWEQTDALLSRLPELEELLQTALNEAGTFVDAMTLTINTAGGFTAESLTQGGINAAILPAADYIICEEAALCIAMSDEEVCETVIALSRTDEGLGGDFPEALFEALTTTESGAQFLALCCPDTDFTTPTEETLQAVRDLVAAQEAENL